MYTAYLLLGSNEGDRTGWLKKAVKAIGDSCGTVVKQSAIYETAAWGIRQQPDFLNQVLELSTALSPLALLREIQQIEEGFGRQRELKWGQRTLDIDILFFDDLVVETKELQIPHPHLHERRFTLEPLNEIAPGLIHPVLKRTVARLLEECTDTLPVRRL